MNTLFQRILRQGLPLFLSLVIFYQGMAMSISLNHSQWSQSISFEACIQVIHHWLTDADLNAEFTDTHSSKELPENQQGDNETESNEKEDKDLKIIYLSAELRLSYVIIAWIHNQEHLESNADFSLITPPPELA